MHVFQVPEHHAHVQPNKQLTTKVQLLLLASAKLYVLRYYIIPNVFYDEAISERLWCLSLLGSRLLLHLKMKFDFK